MGQAIGAVGNLASGLLGTATKAIGSITGALGNPANLLSLVCPEAGGLADVLGPLLGKIAGEGMHIVGGLIPGAAIGSAAKVGGNLFGSLGDLLVHQLASGGANVLGSVPGASNVVQTLASSQGVQPSTLIALLTQALSGGGQQQAVQPAPQYSNSAPQSSPALAELMQALQQGSQGTQQPNAQVYASGRVVRNERLQLGDQLIARPSRTQEQFAKLSFAFRFTASCAFERQCGSYKHTSKYASTYVARRISKGVDLNAKLGANLLWDLYTSTAPTDNNLAALREAFLPGKTTPDIDMYIGMFGPNSEFDFKGLTVSPFRCKASDSSYKDQIYLDGSIVKWQGPTISDGNATIDEYIESAARELIKHVSTETVAHGVAAIVFMLASIIPRDIQQHVFQIQDGESIKSEMFNLEDTTPSRLTDDAQAKGFCKRNILVSDAVIKKARKVDMIGPDVVSERKLRKRGRR